MPKHWSWQVEPPDGWSPVADVCGSLFADLDGLTRRVDATVSREIPEFEPSQCAFTLEERFRSSRRNNADFLRSVAEDRMLTEQEIELRRGVGRAGAMRGMPMKPLIGSFHVGYRQVWSELVEHAVRAGGPAPVLLLNAGSRVWDHIHTTVNAIAEGYEIEGARLEALEARTAERLVDLLTRGAAADESRTLVVQLGFDSDGSFRAVAIVGPAASFDVARHVVAAVEQRGALAKRAQRGATSAIIVQGIDRSELDEILAATPEGTTTGVGRQVNGFAGVALSLEDAEHALALSAALGRVRHFEDDWLLSVAMSGKESIETLLEPGVRVGKAHPHLAEAIRVFAESLSMAEGARRLHVSHNSFRYRLMRWEELTGWTPWTLLGLARSVLALEIGSSAQTGRLGGTS